MFECSTPPTILSSSGPISDLEKPWAEVSQEGLSLFLNILKLLKVFKRYIAKSKTYIVKKNKGKWVDVKKDKRKRRKDR